MVPGSRGGQEQWGIRGPLCPRVTVHTVGQMPAQPDHNTSVTKASWVSLVRSFWGRGGLLLAELVDYIMLKVIKSRG